METRAQKMRRYQRAWYERNRDRVLEESRNRTPAQKAEKSAYDKQRRAQKLAEMRAYDAARYQVRKFGTPRAVYARAKQRAKRYGVPFDISIEDIVIPELCPVFGKPLIPKKGSGGGDWSPSLDKRIPSLGYIKGNICVISSKANRMKSNATAEEIRQLAEWMASH